ncbi:cytochrome b [Rudaeicoccus suwonensis]|uniref:Cytochrome bc1 complex cytochrome b subunit n=1 Tax=Rudaeicoccus suwonensis TaxID=657409 RepID=A0A561EBN5_9MICO|nr:ubiquinol-cytochrome c reductase cytochrome b subunit [Rudaeicoccus suwonensis]TWE13024.1 menaquinol-cytochrome c reductase cytochrome b subunit precursor [Rudaeicoccus suwonensis]
MSSNSGAESLRANDKTGAPSGDGGPIGGVASWVDERTGAAKGVRYLMKKVFPDHWSFMLGEIAMYSLIILLISGTFLTFWFVPSMGETTYTGSYVPLRGVQMSEAFASTVKISMDIRGGLLMRQIHHWAALIFVVSIALHMFRVFFTGAFRKPREINWMIGLILALLAMVEGFIGYSLPDDLLSGTGIRAMQGFILSIPVLGTYISYFLFGGGFPGEDIIPRFFTIHVLLLPAILVGLFTAHIILVMVHKHTQYPGPGRTDKNVVGYPMMPVYAAKAGGFFFVVFGITALIAGLVSINPIWMYGPYEPTMVTAGSQPDWYMGFADGALRLLPGFLEFNLFHRTFSFNIMIGAILLLPILWTIMGAYPFVESWVIGDKREHHILDRPRNAPTRTGLGMAAITFYGILFAACGNDIIAVKFQLSIDDITRSFQVGLIIMPPIVFWVTKRLCLSLQRRDRDLVLHGRESGRIVRTAEGRFFEAHEPLNEYDRWRLVSFEAHEPIALPAGTDENGVRKATARKDRLRARLSHYYFKDRIEPVTPLELAAAHHDGHAHEAIESHPDESESGHMHGGAEELGESHAYGHPSEHQHADRQP